MRAAVLERFGEPLAEAEVELTGLAPDEAPAGQTVAVIGCGGVGLNAIQAAR